jgi:DNA polymerase-3 subunit delta
MKISAAAADRFATDGPDQGLVRERAERLTCAVVDDASDPFRVAEITAAALRDDPARLADEAGSLSLMGGRRVVRLREATDGVTDLIKGVLDGPTGDSLVVVEAGDLGRQSRLRKLFEGVEIAAALPCYADDERALESVIRQTLGDKGLEVSDDAVIYLRDNLGGDRMVTRSELEKLTLYAGASGRVTLEDVVACVGDSAAIAIEDIAFAAASGNQSPLLRALDRAFEEGVEPVRVLRAVTRHFQRLHLCAGQLAQGMSVGDAMKYLRPPVFFKRADEFRDQLRRWGPAALARAMVALTEAELACKSTGMPAQATCCRCLMRLAVRAQGARG